MNRIYILLFLCMLTSCNNNVNIPQGDELWQCVNKYDSKANITYLKSKAFLYISKTYDMEMTIIDDINGKRWSINKFEQENYTCTNITQKYKEPK